MIIFFMNKKNMFRNVGERLLKEDKYTTENHRTQFEKELEEDYGYEFTEEFQKELEDSLYVKWHRWKYIFSKVISSLFKISSPCHFTFYI